MRKIVMFTAALTALVGTQVALAASFAVAGAVATTASPKKQPVTLGFDNGKSVRATRLRPDQAQAGQQARADLDVHERG